jgi:membrane protein YdbS with pleckstrin-like domain
MDVAILAGAVLAFAWVLSVLGTIVAFAGFAVAREGERLRIRRGIIERREASVPVARVHAIRVIESPLREPLGFAQVRVETAGYADEPSTAQTLLPLVRRSQVARVLADLLPELELPPEALTHLEPPPRRALRRQLAGRSRSRWSRPPRSPPSSAPPALPPSPSSSPRSRSASPGTARPAGGWATTASSCAPGASRATRPSPTRAACRPSGPRPPRCSAAPGWRRCASTSPPGARCASRTSSRHGRRPPRPARHRHDAPRRVTEVSARRAG